MAEHLFDQHLVLNLKLLIFSDAVEGLCTSAIQVNGQVCLRCLVLVADRLACVDGCLRREGLLRQVQLLLLLIADRQLPGLEQDTRLPIGQHLCGRDISLVAAPKGCC